MSNKLSKEATDKLNVCGIIGSTILYYPQLGSTFDQIRLEEIKDGLTVVCSKQTSGSGRMGRKWEGPEGGIYFTFEILNPFNNFEIPLLTPVCALGVWRALSKYVPCKIKWPNDIVCHGKKLCGILTKTIASCGKVDVLMVGIGINANTISFPKELCYASSLKLLTGKEVDENILFEQVLNEINTIYTMKPDKVLNLYKDACVNMGKEVVVHFADGREDKKGFCKDILADGSMNVETNEGMINVHSGEVSVKGIYGALENN